MQQFERHAVLDGLNASYGIVDRKGRLLAYEPRFPEWLGATAATVGGFSIYDLIPEFFGLEELFEDVLASRLPFFKLELVNRALPTGLTAYLTLTVLAGRHFDSAGWMVVVQDVTEQGRTLQELTQSRNELALVRRRLDEANRQLDYLLHLYLPPEVADRLVQGELLAELGGDLREVTVLFADIRGYTSASERLPPAETMRMLNDYLGVVVDAVTRHGGTVNQFQGDNLMAIFNAPSDQPDHALRAARAAIAAQRAVPVYHRSLGAGQPRLSFGIGLNTGMALVGNSGGFRRYTYTAIGDTVNLAYRVTAAAPAGDIMLTDTVRQQLAGAVETSPVAPQHFKGKAEPTPLYRIRLEAEQDAS